MLKKRNDLIKLAVCAVLGIALCGASALAEEEPFSVNGVNGYTRLMAEADFEGLPEDQTLPAGSAGIGIFDYQDEASTGQRSARAVRGPTDAVGSENHYMTAELQSIPDAMSDNFLRLRYQVIDPDYNSAQNPTEDLRRKFLEVKLEEDILWSSTALSGNVSFVDYDCQGVQGHGQRPSVCLINFWNGIITLPNAPEEERTASYEANRWYHLTFYLDFLKGTYTAYLDETCIGESVPFYSDGASGIMALSLTTWLSRQDIDDSDGRTERLYIDNIRYHAAPMTARAFVTDRIAVENNFSNGMPSSSFSTLGSFASKGKVTWKGARVDAETHGSVIRLSQTDTAGEITDGYFRSSYCNMVGTDDPGGDQTVTDPEELAELKHVFFSFDLMFSDWVNGYLNYVDKKADNRRSVVGLAHFDPQGYAKFYTNTKDMVRTPANVIAYEPMKWYNFRLYMDFETQTYTLCVNGRNIMERQPLPTGTNPGLYCFTVYFQFGSSSHEGCEDDYVEIDNYVLRLANCTYTPRLNRLWQSPNVCKLACFPARAVDMVFAKYDPSGTVLQGLRISRGDDTTYHLMEIREEPGMVERVFWWQLDQLVSLSGMPLL